MENKFNLKYERKLDLYNEYKSTIDNLEYELQEYKYKLKELEKELKGGK